MTDLFTLFASEVLVAAALVGLILHGRESVTLKVAALGLGGTAMLLGWVALTDFLSRPKPLFLERRPALVREAEVIAGRIVEDEAIHLWLMPSGSREPRAYTLPWDRRRAEELQGALMHAGRDGRTIRFRLPGSEPDDLEPMFHPEPPPQSPPKTVPGTAMLLQVSSNG